MFSGKSNNSDRRSISSFSQENGAKGKSTRTFDGQPDAAMSVQTFKTPPPDDALPPRPELEKSIGENAAGDFDSFSDVPNNSPTETTYAEQLSKRKQEKARARDEKLLAENHWSDKAGHTLTYTGIFLFTLVIYFRPYELIPALASFNSMALVVAVATLLVYLPTQFAGAGNLTVFTTEVKCILVMVACAVLTIPIARDPALAWTAFSENFSKVAIIFVIIVNILDSKKKALRIDVARHRGSRHAELPGDRSL